MIGIATYFFLQYLRLTSYRGKTTGRMARLILVVLGMAMLGGCGQERIKTNPVSGSVVFQNKPAVGAVVTLHPKGEWPHKALPQGTTDDDGNFRIGTLDMADGAPRGDYVATVQWFPVAPDGSVGRNALPPRYASRDSTPLNVTVQGGANALPTFRIDKK